MSPSEDVVLRVDGLSARYLNDGKIIKAVNDVTFDVHRGESVGLFGESGAGKSTVGYAIMGLFERMARQMSSSAGDKEFKELWKLRDDARRRGLTSADVGRDLPGLEGRILFQGQDLLSMNEEDILKIVGKDITHIPQGTVMSLNPALSLKVQIFEAAWASGRQGDLPHKELAMSVMEKLDLVDFGDPEVRMAMNPTQLSVGEVQRILTAMALLPRPTLVIADEPTTAVDNTIRNWILDSIALARKEEDLSLLMINNDRTVIAETVDKVAVMSSGYIVEFGDVAMVLNSPGHPFSEDFLLSFPTMEMMRKIREKGLRLRGIPGSPPSMADLPSGCTYRTRCQHCKEICRTDVPEYREVEQGHWIRCHRYEEIRD